MKKLSNTEAELKIALLIKKACKLRTLVSKLKKKKSKTFRVINCPVVKKNCSLGGISGQPQIREINFAQIKGQRGTRISY